STPERSLLIKTKWLVRQQRHTTRASSSIGVRRLPHSGTFHCDLSNSRRIHPMTERIMQQAFGRTRPLSLDAEGAKTLLLESASTPWAGLQFEMHRTGPGEFQDVGPPEGEFGLVVLLEGSIEMAIQKKGHGVSYRAVPGSTSFLAGDNL